MTQPSVLEQLKTFSNEAVQSIRNELSYKIEDSTIPYNVWKLEPGDLVPIFAYFIPIGIKTDCIYVSVPLPHYATGGTPAPIVSNFTGIKFLVTYYLNTVEARKYIWGNFIFSKEQHDYYHPMYTKCKTNFALKKVYAGLFVTYEAFRTKGITELTANDLVFALNKSEGELPVEKKLRTIIFNIVKAENIGLIYTEDINQYVLPHSKLVTSLFPDNIADSSIEEYRAYLNSLSDHLSSSDFMEPSYIPLKEPVQEETVLEEELPSLENISTSEENSVEENTNSATFETFGEIIATTANNLPPDVDETGIVHFRNWLPDTSSPEVIIAEPSRIAIDTEVSGVVTTASTINLDDEELLPVRRRVHFSEITLVDDLADNPF